mgnify:FL=1
MIQANLRLVVRIAQPFPNHNGGQIAFGPDGELYIGMGDGGAAGDPYGNGQNRHQLLGKILRIDPQRHTTTRGYAIPTDNPFVGSNDAAPEIWLVGLRNPWRFSFDRSTGDLWIGDVGQDTYEEVDHIGAGVGGENLGWNRREGTHDYNGGARRNDDVEPVYDYRHGSAACSITGGFVYRGRAIVALRGTYVFADFCGGALTGLTLDAQGQARARDLAAHVDQPTTFGETPDGELLVASRTGTVYEVVAAR